MKAIKITFAIVVVVLLLVVGGVFALLLNLEGIVEETVEKRGPDVTLTPVNLGGVNIKIFQGLAELNHFEVANPKGFTSAHAFKADVLRIKVDPKSLSTGVIVLDDITMEGINLVAEQKGLTTNLQELHRAIKQFTGRSGSGETADESPASSAKEPRFMLRNLSFKNNSMRLITEKYGDYSVEIPALERSNIGGANGMTSSELAVAIMEPIIERAEKSAKEKLKKVAKSEVEDKVKAQLEEKLDDDSKSAVNKLKGLLGR
jgi:hypothetical protein